MGRAAVADELPSLPDLVAGVIEGELDEWIVFGAHHDHLGYGYFGSRDRERMGEIHNGADDNASGTAAIIEIARAAVRERERFARTLVFIAFAGEERGLLGSAHYVQNPARPIDRTIAMLNLDMVGRLREKLEQGSSSDPAERPR